jgi:hypothetical protein
MPAARTPTSAGDQCVPSPGPSSTDRVQETTGLRSGPTAVTDRQRQHDLTGGSVADHAGHAIREAAFEATYAFAYDLPPGASTVSAGAVPSASETTSETLRPAFRGAVVRLARQDVPDAGRPVGPNNASARTSNGSIILRWHSYVLDRAGSPKVAGISSLRLRGAYGARAGSRANDAIPYYASPRPTSTGPIRPRRSFGAGNAQPARSGRPSWSWGGHPSCRTGST